MPKAKAIRTVMLHDIVGNKKAPTAIICTYNVRKGGKITYKTLTLTGIAEVNFYEWLSENQAVAEHKRAVAHYRSMS